MSDKTVEQYFKQMVDLNRALGDDAGYKVYLEAIKKRNPNEELSIEDIKSAFRKMESKASASEKALKKRGIKKAKGGVVEKKFKKAGRLAKRGYGKAIKGVS
jgi:ribonuclease I